MKTMMTRVQTRLMAVLTAMLLTTAFSLRAEEAPENYVPYPYAFIGLQGGGQTTLTDYNMWKLGTPTGSVYVGVQFTPVVGARLHVNGIWNKNAICSNGAGVKYKYKYATSDLDLMINMVNLLSKRKYNPINVFLIGGVGINYAWDNEEVPALNQFVSTRDCRSRLSHNFRVGAMFDVKVARNWSVNLEVDANSLSDHYNSQYNGGDDWQLTAQVGLTYKFGLPHKVKGSHKDSDTSGGSDISDMTTDASIANTNVGITKNNEVLPAIQEPEPTPPAVLTKINNRRDVFFTIRQTEVSSVEMPKVKEMADWLKAHPSAKVVVTGYADKGTGTSENNARFARERAESVTKLLTKKFGIEPSRITTDSKGDTIQPYPNNNDQNRVTIMIAEGEE